MQIRKLHHDIENLAQIPKKFLVQHGIPKEKADHFVKHMIANQADRKNFFIAAAVTRVQNLVHHLSKTPQKLENFIEKFCERFPAK